MVFKRTIENMVVLIINQTFIFLIFVFFTIKVLVYLMIQQLFLYQEIHAF